jgi:hypothetical protein
VQETDLLKILIDDEGTALKHRVTFFFPFFLLNNIYACNLDLPNLQQQKQQ